jgi:environmental stress-induced protein Ves
MNTRSATAGLHPLPASCRQIEHWTNGLGRTVLLLREPDDAEWRVRVSIANVEQDGPFSGLPHTRRLLVPLDASMELRFPDGRVERTERFGVLRFEGDPAPFGVLPEGPTRDFNLMLRQGARGELFARTLVDSIVLLPERGVRWLLYVNRGEARVGFEDSSLSLAADEAALLEFQETALVRATIEGGGEMVLAKLWA